MQVHMSVYIHSYECECASMHVFGNYLVQHTLEMSIDVTLYTHFHLYIYSFKPLYRKQLDKIPVPFWVVIERENLLYCCKWSSMLIIMNKTLICFSLQLLLKVSWIWNTTLLLSCNIILCACVK